MTTVTATLTGANGQPARGYLRFTPTTDWTGATGVTLPLPQTVKLVGGSASVELVPSGLNWSWEVTYMILGVEHWVAYYVVPDSGIVTLSSLVSVNPDTLTQQSTPAPSWYTYVDNIVAGQVGRVVVVTGSEPRPGGFGSVFWVGGTTQPVNMVADTDIWFKASS